MWDIEAVYFDCALYLFTALLAVMTFYQLRSAFMVTLFVIFPAIFRVIFRKLYHAAPNSNILFNFSFNRNYAVWIFLLFLVDMDALAYWAHSMGP